MQIQGSIGRRLRVLTLVDGIGVSGGGERLARDIVVRLDPARFERTLCVSRWPDGIESEPAVARALEDLKQAGVGFVGLNRKGSADLISWRPLLALLRGGVDILHTHKFGSNAWGAVLGTLARTPTTIAHEHTWSFQGQWMRRQLDRWLIGGRADAILTVSREDRRRMIEIEGIDPDKLIFVPNGIPRPPTPSNRDVRQELGIGPEAPVVGTVCALRPQKALGVLLDASVELRDRFPGRRVLIVGDGPERAALERRIDELGLAETVTLLGHRDDVRDVLGALDVAACSSDFEGTPLSILEYMDAALPVVATRVGGIPDLISPAVNGTLVDPRSPRDLGTALAELLANPALAEAMGARGRQRQRREFDISVTVKEVERIYQGLASGVTAQRLAADRVVQRDS